MRVLLAAIFIGLTSFPAFAQTQRSVQLDGAFITLGEPEKSIRAKLEKLGPTYQLGYPYEKGDSHTLSRKLNGEQRDIGVIYFSSGKVSGITRIWTEMPGHDAHNLAKSIFAAIDSLSASEKKKVQISTRIDRAPNSEGYTLILSAGSKEIALTFDSAAPENVNHVLVTEAISTP
jgi:hypothetical protein